MSRDIAGGEHGPRRVRYIEAWLLWDRADISPVPPVVSSCSVGFCVRVQLLILESEASSLVVMTRSLISSSCLDALQKLGVFCVRQDLSDLISAHIFILSSHSQTAVYVDEPFQSSFASACYYCILTLN